MNTYRVDVTRDGRWWMIAVPDLDGVTQARRVGEVEDMARSFISAYLDVAPSSFAIDVHYDRVGDVDMQQIMTTIGEIRAAAERTQAEYNAALRDAAGQLTRQGVSLRDAATVLEVSHQRVQQIIDGSKAKA